MGPSQFCATIWREASGLFLDGIELRDPADGLFGNWGTLRPVDVDKLSSDMGHAGDLTDCPGSIEVFEPGMALLHKSREGFIS